MVLSRVYIVLCLTFLVGPRDDSFSRGRCWPSHRGEKNPIVKLIDSHNCQDAYVLAGLLAHSSTTRETVALALKAYEHVRLPMAKRVMQCSRETGRIIQLAAEYEGDYDRLRESLQDKWDWVSGPGPHAELDRAIRWCYPDESVGISA